MTKVSVFGQETEKKKGNPIEFVKRINSDGSENLQISKPNEWNNVMLYRKETGVFDIILAWDNNDGEKAVFLGHWNDGFVE